MTEGKKPMKKESRSSDIQANDGDAHAEPGSPPKDDLDIVIYHDNEYYFLPAHEWKRARKLGQGERTVLVPLIEHGVIVAHVDEDSPRFGTWTNLVNLSALVATHKGK